MSESQSKSQALHWLGWVAMMLGLYKVEYVEMIAQRRHPMNGTPALDKILQIFFSLEDFTFISTPGNLGERATWGVGSGQHTSIDL